MMKSSLWVSNDEPCLQTAFAETERAVGEAFARAVGVCGRTVPPPQFGENPDEKVSRWIEWWIDVPDPFDSLSCEVLLLHTDEGPEVSGKIAVWKYLGRGCSDDTALWASEPCVVMSPTEAAAVVRQVTAELVRQLGILDLRPYLTGKAAEPT